MTTFSFVLVLCFAVLASAVVHQVVSRVSMPLVQIGLGAAIALLGGVSMYHFQADSELFLVLFIAPLLFQEARGVDKVALWSNRRPVASLAIGLVVAVALIVGFFAHAIEPSIPLAAAFALGAALGPTDAVAVSSLSKRASLTPKQEVLLSGESLINAASGAVSFQFAIAALTTGSFSLLGAGASFALSFFGGILVGIALEIVISSVMRTVRALGVDDTTFHVLFDLATPFVVFLAAESLHVSGILAVVAAGLSYSFLDRRIGPSVARMNIVSSSVWQVLTFALNGIVFVLLGMQLPNAMSDSWHDAGIADAKLIGLVVLVSAVVVAVRMLWFLAMDLYRRIADARAERVAAGASASACAYPSGPTVPMRSGASRAEGFDPASPMRGEARLWLRSGILRDSLVMALAGPKGAISLSIMFTLPYVVGSIDFASRDLLLFLASGVILITLLLANFLLPVLSPIQDAAPPSSDQEALVEVLRAVIADLDAMQTPGNRRAVQSVIRQYNDRIAHIKQRSDAFDRVDNVALRIEVIGWQEAYVTERMHEDASLMLAGHRLLSRYARAKAALGKRGVPRFVFLARKRVISFNQLIAGIIADRRLFRQAFEQEKAPRELHADALTHAVGKLRARLSDEGTPSEDAAEILLEMQKSIRRLRRADHAAPGIATATRVDDAIDEVRLEGLERELHHIQAMYDDGLISRQTAQRLRDNVRVMQLDQDGFI